MLHWGRTTSHQAENTAHLQQTKHSSGRAQGLIEFALVPKFIYLFPYIPKALLVVVKLDL